ncbi:hypothetical protein [Methylobacterium sp. A54F]
MNARTPFPARVRLLIPLLASKHVGEVVGTAGALGRTLEGAGLDYHDLAAAIPITADEATMPAFDTSGWQAASARPAPPYRPSRRSHYVFTPAQTAEHRRMALFCRNEDHGRLSPREREFVANVASWRRELSIAQADWLADITDRLEDPYCAEQGRAGV